MTEKPVRIVSAWSLVGFIAAASATVRAQGLTADSYRPIQAANSPSPADGKSHQRWFWVGLALVAAGGGLEFAGHRGDPPNKERNARTLAGAATAAGGAAILLTKAIHFSQPRPNAGPPR